MMIPKPYRLSLLLGLGCVLLGLVLIVQWRYELHQHALLQKKLQKTVAAKLSLGDAPKDNLVLGKAGKFRAMVNKPLFIKNRKPLPPPEDIEDVVEEIAPEPVTELSAKLTGYIEVPDGQIALIQDTKTRKYSRMRQGEVMNEWILTEIHPHKVVFQQRDVVEEVLLHIPKTKPEPAKAGQSHTVQRRDNNARRSRPKAAESARRRARRTNARSVPSAAKNRQQKNTSQPGIAPNDFGGW